jgi:Flp pilus assembly protein TadD
MATLPPGTEQAAVLDLPTRIGMGEDDRRRLTTLATALYLEGRLPAAAQVFAGLAALWPRRAELWSALGATLLRLERWDDAVAALDRALALQPDDHAARVNRAEGAVALGRLEAAAADLVFVIGRDPAAVDPVANRARQMALALYAYERASRGAA